jgi:hypothetical protein
MVLYPVGQLWMIMEIELVLGDLLSWSGIRQFWYFGCVSVSQSIKDDSDFRVKLTIISRG